MTARVYWGDLHSHCSVSYGEGTVAQALLRARRQLDFCSITGHAFWPDMPTDRERYGRIIDYHREGFARLAKNWDGLLAELWAASKEGEFVALPSYEWHSLEYGDHNVYARGPDLPLRDGANLRQLRELAMASGAIMVPHHIGYAAGFRGIDWRHFDASASPVVEIYSLHGASISASTAFPMLHDMGPTDYGSTAVAGWRLGHRFGVIASTDHHGGYPGSHGDGCAAVLADALTRDALWEAICARRTYAVTGDKIRIDMTLNDAPIGSELTAAKRRCVRVQVTGLDELDRVELLKNEQVVARWHAGDGAAPERSTRGRLRVTWGWGRKDEPAYWDAELTIDEGEIRDVTSCFSGQSVVAPKGVAGHSTVEDQADLPHEITAREPRRVAWRSVTTGNLSTRHRTTQALSLLLDAPPSARVTVRTSHGEWTHSLAELRHGGCSHYQQGWLSPALVVGPFVEEQRCQAIAEWTDDLSDTNDLASNAGDAPLADYYRLRVAQANGQWAWASPIWVERQ
ncbi:MAG: hypothetical protein KDB14_30765 [Planctomycetales bacterium]|nr:hypothetical protein [Planctomycetales bacterium]